jgi:hypothetical protein
MDVDFSAEGYVLIGDDLVSREAVLDGDIDRDPDGGVTTPSGLRVYGVGRRIVVVSDYATTLPVYTATGAIVRVLDVRPGTAIKDGDEILGKLTKVKIVKNKVAPPFRKCEFDIMFCTGISRVGEILDIAVDKGIVKKSGSWFSYGESKLAQGREAVLALLKDNPELCEELEAKVREAINQ